MKNIFGMHAEKSFWKSLGKGWRAACVLALGMAIGLALALPMTVRAEEGFPGDDVNRRLDRVLDGNQQNQDQGNADEQGGAFIGTNEEGDSVMSTGPRRVQSGGSGQYEDGSGMVIYPQITPIIPLPPGPRPPVNPYPGPGPHPGPRPRDGVNQMHEYNYNPEYHMEVPRRPGRF